MYACCFSLFLSGGMQDYNYVWAQCLEITLELSCCKFPPEHDLPGLWEANKPALLAYMQQVHLGTTHPQQHKQCTLWHPRSIHDLSSWLSWQSLCSAWPSCRHLFVKSVRWPSEPITHLRSHAKGLMYHCTNRGPLMSNLLLSID